MALDAAKNFAKSQISTGYNSAATSIVLVTAGGAKFPAVSFNAVWWDATLYLDPSDDPSVEVVRVTNISTDTLTVTRAQEGTTNSNHNTAGHTYMLAAGPTAKLVTDLGSVTDDTTTNATMFPMWATAATGNLAKYVSSTKLVWNPSTGNFGIGTAAPQVALEVANATTAAAEIQVTNNSRSGGIANVIAEKSAGGTVTGWLPYAAIYGNGGNYPTQLIQNNNPYLTVAIGGNVGIGTTAPSAHLEVVADQALSSIRVGGLEIQSYAANNSWVGFNSYFDGANNKYRATATACQIQNLGGDIAFLTAPSGTAGNTITFSEKMRILNTGNVGIGTTAPTSPLQVVTLPTYATNALALAGGLTAGAFFKVNVAGEYFVHVVV